MTVQTPTSDNFWPLVDAACDGSLDETQVDELAAVLESDATSLKVFADHVQLRTDIGLLCRAERCSEGGLARVRATLAPGSPPLVFLGDSTGRGTVGYSLQTWSLAYLVAAVVFGIALWIGSFTRISRRDEIASNSPLPAPTLVDAKTESVGRITGLVDCRWADPTTKALVRDDVPLGRKYAMASGLMEITYDTGAKVILQGPATYEVESARSGYLSLGRLTARMEKKAEGGGRRAEEEGGSRQGEVGSGQWAVGSESKIQNSKSEILTPPSALRPPLSDQGSKGERTANLPVPKRRRDQPLRSPLAPCPANPKSQIRNPKFLIPNP